VDKGVPAFSLLWLSEPDATSTTRSWHDQGFEGTESSDDNLARVLKELVARGVRDKTDVFVISDHGFSTTSRSVDIAAFLKRRAQCHARILAAARQWRHSGDRNGGTELFYVIGHDSELTHKIVELLQAQDFAGRFSRARRWQGRSPRPGPHQYIGCAGHRPLVPMDHDKNGEGSPARSSATVATPGTRVHTSLSPFDRTTRSSPPARLPQGAG